MFPQGLENSKKCMGIFSTTEGGVQLTSPYFAPFFL